MTTGRINQVKFKLLHKHFVEKTQWHLHWISSHHSQSMRTPARHTQLGCSKLLLNEMVRCACWPHQNDHSDWWVNREHLNNACWLLCKLNATAHATSTCSPPSPISACSNLRAQFPTHSWVSYFATVQNVCQPTANALTHHHIQSHIVIHLHAQELHYACVFF